jgi:uncharacterized protein with HEPN domain
MPKDDRLYLGHMLDLARKALQLAHGKSRAEYDRDESLRLALAHLLQVIGEAARRLSAAYCQTHPEIPWKAIIGMRHKVVHDYMTVDEDVIWDTVAHELQPLVAELERLLPREPDTN